MKNDDLFTTHNDQSNDPILLVASSIDFLNHLIQTLKTFIWPSGKNISLIHFNPDESSDHITKVLVPLLEKKRRFLFVTSQEHSVQNVLLSLRYLNRPFIFNSIRENIKDITLFYNTTNIIPDNLFEKKIQNLLRLDYSGIQIHQTEPLLTTLMEYTQCRVQRLGQIKENIYICEPNIRDADIVCLNMNVLKYSEAPAQEQISQSGIQSEDACQLVRYAGMSDKMKATIITGIDESKDPQGITQNVVAQMIWYFMDAFSARKGDFPESMKDTKEYLVSMDGYDSEFTFIKSEKSGRWWLKSDHTFPPHLKEHSLYPVNYEDYELTSQGEISEEVIKGLLWLEHLAAWKQE